MEKFVIFTQQPMIELTDVLKREHEAAEKCYIRLKEFNDPHIKKVRGHCYYTGFSRGAAHNNCNLKYRIPDHIPILFHNLSGYDAYLFIKELGKRFNKHYIGALQKTRRSTSVLMLKLMSS